MPIPRTAFSVFCMWMMFAFCSFQNVLAAPNIKERPSQPTGEHRGRSTASSSDNTESDTTQPVFEDDFSSNTAKWWLGTEKDSGGAIEARLAKGSLHLIINNQEARARYVPVPDLKIRDFMLTVDVAVEKATGESAVTYIDFRKNSAGDFYSMMVSNLGTYAFAIFHNEQWQILQEWTASSAIDPRPGKFNEFGVRAVGNLFVIFVNGEELVTVRDPNSILNDAGEMMLGVGTPANTESIINFDNLRVVNVSPGDVDSASPQTQRISDEENQVSYLVPKSWELMLLEDPGETAIVVGAKASDESAMLFVTVGSSKRTNEDDLTQLLKTMELQATKSLALSCQSRKVFDYEGNGFSGLYSVKSSCNSKSDHLLSLIVRPDDRSEYLLAIGGYFSDDNWMPILEQAIQSLIIKEKK